MKESDSFTKRIQELAARAENRNVFTFTDFLSPSGLSEIKSMPEGKTATYFGGSDASERKMVRFGREEELGYSKPFPIILLKIKPKGEKFSGGLCHRDFLGALLSLGIERDKIGDIFVNDNTAYVFINETLSDFIQNELTRVGRDYVTVSEEETLPEEFYPKTQNKRVNVSSLRLDAIIARLYNLPREAAAELIKNGKVYINGSLLQKSFYEPNKSDVVIVRGFGKFVFNGVDGTSSKGRLFVSVTVYC